LKQKFREGHHAAAIAECEARCRQEPANPEIKRLCAMMHAAVQNYGRALELLQEIRNPASENAEVLFNIGVCERELKNLQNAAQYFKIYTEKFPNDPDGWATLAECRFQLREFDEAIRLTDRAIKLASSSLPAWTVRGNCQKAMGRFEDALASYQRANQIQPTVESRLNEGLTFLEIDKPTEAIGCFTEAIALAPDLAAVRISRGDAFRSLGKLQEAVADYRAALTLQTDDGEALRKASLCLLDLNQASQAMELCRDILRIHPDMLMAKLGVDWILSKLVPIWHAPMMNEQERNGAYYDGLKSVVTPEKVVFEIGTGSGLLAMMAAKLGAKKVFTCEAVGLIAETAGKIIKRNNYQDKITVLSKPSHAVQLEKDLPAKADILVHEIFSSELLGEHVLPAIEDAMQRLLKPGGDVLPSAASIMIALVGGDEVGKNLHVDESFGFDLRDFNAINPRRRPLYRGDLALVLMSNDIEAFRFDFCQQSRFPPEKKSLEISAIKEGRCYGIIQWIRLEFGQGVHFENHPSQRRPISNWEHTVYGFDEPVYLNKGSVVSVVAMHDRSRPWFEPAAGRSTPFRVGSDSIIGPLPARTGDQTGA
jgi:tetratricopeptide (TPR) repeat protein